MRPRIRTVLATAATVLVVSVNGCGGSGGQDADDDLLAPSPQAADLDESGTEVQWRFPASYEPDDEVEGQASSDADGVELDLLVGARDDTDPDGAAEEFTAGLFDDVDVERETVDVGGAPIILVSAETGEMTNRAYFFDLDGSDSTYTVLFYATTPGDDLPPERVEELTQMLASFSVS